MAAKIFWFIGIVWAIALLVLFFSQVRSNARVEEIARSLQVNSDAEVFTEDTIADFPEPVRRYFRHAIASGTRLATSVRLKMRGSIRLARDRPWMPLQAEETLSVKGFVWQATAGEGTMKIQGADYYTLATIVNSKFRRRVTGLENVVIPVIQAQRQLPELIDSVSQSHQPITIAGDSSNAVLLSEADWASVQETLYLLSIPGMRESIREGLATPIEQCSSELEW